jgi:hypothetical protein
MSDVAGTPVAAFGQDTMWAGTRITWDGRDFVLEGHGPIAPQDVMHYDSERWLVWAGEGTRAWVGARAAAQERALEKSGRASERSERAKRVIVVAIGVLLAVNLVLLVVLARTVGFL